MQIKNITSQLWLYACHIQCGLEILQLMGLNHHTLALYITNNGSNVYHNALLFLYLCFSWEDIFPKR